MIFGPLQEIKDRLEYIIEYDLHGEDHFDAYTLNQEINTLENKLFEWEGFLQGRTEKIRQRCLLFVDRIREIYELEQYRY